MRQEKLRRFLALEQLHIDACLTQCFGAYLLLLGDSQKRRVRESPAHVHIVAGSEIKSDVAVQIEESALPFAPNSVDVIVLLHALEQSHDPDALLKEAYTLLRHDGHILIVGFNPWRRFGKKAGKALYGEAWVKAYSVPHMLRTLGKEGFSVVQMERFGFYLNKDPEINSDWERLGKRLWPECSTAYWILAEKHTQVLTPLGTGVWVPEILKVKPVLSPTPVVKRTPRHES